MKKTGDKNLETVLVSSGRRNGLLRILVLPVLMTVICLRHMAYCLRKNVKRLALITILFLIVADFGSFSFPIAFPRGNKFMREAQILTISDGDSGSDQSKNTEKTDQTDDYISEDLEEKQKDLQDMDKYDLDDLLEAGSTKKSSGKKDTPVFTGSFSKDDWRLVLVNKQHPISEDYTFNLGVIKGNMRCDERILEELTEMMSAAREDGINLVICSPYRDMERQEMLFERKIRRYINQGMSYMEAYKEASQTVTVPGASEHQIGLALDIVSNGYSALDEGFGETEAGKWLAANGADYGFILRYPKGKEYITGISYEPWHFRYVGREAATIIMDKGITLEEFWEDL